MAEPEEEKSDLSRTPTDTDTAPNRVQSYTRQGTVPDRAPDSDSDGLTNEIANLVARKMAEADGNPQTHSPGGVGQRTYLKTFEDEIPARMLNEYVYCPRLFYYEFVEGVFVHNADTRRGLSTHSRVDRAKPGSLSTKQAGRNRRKPSSGESGGTDEDATDEPEVIHSRSVSLGSERLGVTAKLDLVEARRSNAASDSILTVSPVEYKLGSPREDHDGLPSLWDTDKMQLGLQILLLRDNGFACDEGIVFYRGTRQRVRLGMTGELEAWIGYTIDEARVVAASPGIPEPLVDSPKCVRCSLAPVCLPDETNQLIDGPDAAAAEESRLIELKALSKPTRRIIASRDVKRVVYLTTPGLQVGISHETLKCSEKGKVIEEIPMRDILHLGLFGNVSLTTPATRELISREIPVSWFSGGGWFYGMTRGHGLTNVMTRIEQFSAAGDPARCLELARQFVRGKIRNARVMLMRNHIEPPPGAIKRLKGAADDDVLTSTSIAGLLGIEGAAARLYFEHFSGMLKPGESHAMAENPDDGIAAAPGNESRPAMTFDFERRNRRPPRDPVNALLSLSYSLLAKDCTVAALAVGFDPYVGFYHQPRHGRPALALDIMEEFRPLVADSSVLLAINNRIVTPEDFIVAGSAVNLSPAGRKRFLQAWERRMSTTISHPVFGYQVSYRRAIELQFRMLAKVLTGEIKTYIPFLTR